MHAGLCELCAYQRVVISGRGSRFSMCELARERADIPKYPRVPVMACEGFVRRTEDAGSTASPDADQVS